MRFLKFVLIALIILRIPTVFSQLNQQIQVDVVYLASEELEGRATGTKGESLAASYIVSRMKSLGLKPGNDGGWYQSFKIPANPHMVNSAELTGKNVIGYLDRKAKSSIIIGAHYDHLGHGVVGSLAPNDHNTHNGADDNASGVAAMLWIAEKLTQQKKLEHNIIFIAFSGEEYGLFGSKAYIENPTIPKENISAMINMDMVGRLNAENVIAISGVGTSSKWNNVLQEIKPADFTFNNSESGLGPSDHSSFYLKEIPVLHFFTGQHKDYHKPSDDSYLVNYEGIEKVANIIYDIVVKIDPIKKIDFIKTKDQSKEMATDFKVTLGVMPDYVYNGNGMRIDAVLEGRAAMKAGMKDGDIIIHLAGEDIKDIHDYMKVLSENKKGDKVKAKVLRDGKEVELDVEF
ncbi:MAG: M20/M25/M40 family metallo-hydrolase [Saprospiraceae bacterium]|nr:M20/M25/M40 family metallo-hydrolase [Saprospiraceae bacterium]